jgi:hypothetical protein
MEWIDGGYKEGETVTVDDKQCITVTSLGSLGWIVKDVSTGKKLIALFTDSVKM